MTGPDGLVDQVAVADAVSGLAGQDYGLLGVIVGGLGVGQEVVLLDEQGPEAVVMEEQVRLVHDRHIPLFGGTKNFSHHVPGSDFNRGFLGSLGITLTSCVLH